MLAVLVQAGSLRSRDLSRLGSFDTYRSVKERNCHPCKRKELPSLQKKGIAIFAKEMTCYPSKRKELLG